MTRRAVLFRIGLSCAGLLLLVVVLVSGLYLWRVPLAQALLDRELAALELPGARATVAEVELDRIRLRDLTAGLEREIEASELTLRFGFPEILRGRADKVELEGLTVRLDLRSGAAPLGSLQAFAERIAARDRAATPPLPAPLPAPLPTVHIPDARVNALTPLGPATLTVDGSLTPHGTSVPTAGFDLALVAPFLTLKARLTAAGDPERRLEAWLEIVGHSLDLPASEVRAASVRGKASILLVNGEPRSGQATIEFAGLSLAGTAFEMASAGLELSETRAAARGRLLAGDESFALTFDGALEDLRGAPRLRLELDAKIDEEAPPWALARPPWPQAGRGRLRATAEGRLGPLDPLPGALAAWLREGAVAGTFDLELERLAFDPPGPNLSARLRGTADWSGKRLAVKLTEDGLLRATGLTAADLVSRGLPAALAEALESVSGGDLTLGLPSAGPRPAKATWRPGDQAEALTLEGTADLSGDALTAQASGLLSFAAEGGLDEVTVDAFSLNAQNIALAGEHIAALALAGTLAGSPDAFEAEVELDARLRRPTFGDWRTETVRVRLPLRVLYESARLDATLAAPGQVVVEGLGLRDAVEAVGPLQVTLEDAGLTVQSAATPPILRHHVRLSAGPSRFHLLRADAEPIAVIAHLPAISWTGGGPLATEPRGEAKLTGGRIELPDHALTLDGLSATLTLPEAPAGAALDFTVAAVRHQGNPQAFAPYRLSGRAARRGEMIELTASGRGPGGLGSFRMTGRHDPAAGAGTLDIVLTPLIFAPDGAQPGQLIPLLSGLSDVRGTVSAAARLRWDEQEFSGTADLTLADLSFETPEAAVEGLNLSLRLDPLVPPASPPGQSLTVDLIDVGLPLEGLSVSFRLPPGPPGRVLLERADFALTGVRFTIGETLIDPAADRNRTLLSVEELDLATLFESLAIEGLSGQGRLSGTIPLVMEGGGVAVVNARLSSAAPGFLRFRSDAAARTLQSGEESVDLLLRALENFHYDSMTLTGGLDPDYEARMRLEIQGGNPDVLDGHPFAININLTGNLGPLIDALREGRAITRDLLRRSWRQVL